VGVAGQFVSANVDLPIDSVHGRDEGDGYESDYDAHAHNYYGFEQTGESLGFHFEFTFIKACGYTKLLD
jgi:hypothetical protein